MAQMIKERGGKKTVGTAWNKSQDKKTRKLDHERKGTRRK